jgi:hypothetical protein
MERHSPHKCQWLSSLTGSKALKITIEHENFTWFLFYETYATEYDVKSGEAEAPGEKLGGIVIAIQYCPFCGHALSNNEGSCS